MPGFAGFLRARRLGIAVFVGLGACVDPIAPRDVPPDLAVSEVFMRAPIAFADAGIPGDPNPVTPAGHAAVVLISVDGLRPDALFLAPAAVLLTLAARGAYTWQAQTVLPSLTLPSHASMLTGMPPAQHQIFHNDGNPNFIAVPTVLGAAKAAGKRVALAVGKDKLAQLAPPGSYDSFRLATAGDDGVIAAAQAAVAAGFDLLFVHLPDVDLVGHTWGWMSAAYLHRVRDADQAVGRLLSVVPSDATVIVTADHGGAGYVHGLAVLEHQTIPWIIAGPGISAGRRLQTPIVTTDTAATIAYILGVPLDTAAPASPVREAWQN